MNPSEGRNTLKNIYLALKSLTVYRKLLDDPVIKGLLALIEEASCEKPVIPEKFAEDYASFYYSLTNKAPEGLKTYMAEKIMLDENAFTRASEGKGPMGVDAGLKEAARTDLSYIGMFSGLASGRIKGEVLKEAGISGFERDVIRRLPEWGGGETAGLGLCADMEGFGMKGADMDGAGIYPRDLIRALASASDWSCWCDALSAFHAKWGCGLFTNHKAFIWYGGKDSRSLREVNSPDPVMLSDFTGYEEERAEVIENTLRFLEGCPANNVLLYGDRGTGKSSTVKALVNEFFDRGLRIVEVPKRHLSDFPEIISLLKDRKQKFIIFIDDLVFEESEGNFTAMKAVLEGGLEVKPANILIYATSNRRHLVKERFSDRSGLVSGDRDDEIRSGDIIQEKLSLSDRFGITVVFSSPDKKKYLEIVDGLAEKRGLKTDRELLHREALKWELWYNGRSPRTARQFMDWFEGRVRTSGT